MPKVGSTKKVVKAKPPNLLLRIRQYPTSKIVDMWLLRKEGPAVSQVMYGRSTLEVAEGIAEIIERSGMAKIQKEHSPLLIEFVEESTEA